MFIYRNIYISLFLCYIYSKCVVTICLTHFQTTQSAFHHVLKDTFPSEVPIISGYKIKRIAMITKRITTIYCSEDIKLITTKNHWGVQAYREHKIAVIALQPAYHLY